MNDWLITNAPLINEGRRYDADGRVRDGRIECIDSQIAATFVNGHLAWDDGKLDESVRGQRLAFDR